MNDFPTQARREFAGDCFGIAHDRRNTICKLCAVHLQCAIEFASRAVEDRDKPLQLYPRSERIYHCRYKKNMGAWAAYQVLVEMHGDFSSKDVIEKFIPFCRLRRIYIGNAYKTIKRVMNEMTADGYLEHKRKSVWARTTKMAL